MSARQRKSTRIQARRALQKQILALQHEPVARPLVEALSKFLRERNLKRFRRRISSTKIVFDSVSLN